MIEKEKWLHQWVAALQKAFGERLLYVGLQGSYRRGEATESSDFDVVTILDRLSPEDLRSCRAILHQMENSETACGFVCGREELLSWPKHELFQFAMDTQDYFGQIKALLPPNIEKAVYEGLLVQAANLYHTVAHLLLYGSPQEQRIGWPSCLKSVFFALQAEEYCRSGIYCSTKRELLLRLQGEEKQLLLAGMAKQPFTEQEYQQIGERLFQWCSQVLKGGGEKQGKGTEGFPPVECGK